MLRLTSLAPDIIEAILRGDEVLRSLGEAGRAERPEPREAAEEPARAT